ncbi:M20/M25/M40 family metallo-hydrolase [Pyrinomonas methylaliphatogenes]|uniref:Acetylornithine deacetylase/succinyldiaminopimelate desuccinylase-like deacylase n=1 Tax=Pyrinomonas methylaliphatogenes TaxID=454194 RepID=A0A0B6X1R2_9BACT|nr:M20/M25/M40 family metallo-hydrolase [Pyrinomonas methylaliphatogenes]CDM66310.1 acetylornithine deacetylase/succinyldiaminopimelate desuccinylase-like deacylase [Pyrinomonas methylaliphatogenes]
MRKLLLALTLLNALAPLVRAGDDARARLLAEIKALLARPSLNAAFNYIDRSRDAILREWIAITEINAPSGKERERAEFVKRLLSGYKLDQVYYDRTGNLVAVRKGTGGGPTVVIDAHLDTVFQEGLKIKAEVRDGRVYAPGIGDDTRNIEAMLAALRALDAANVRTKGDLIFLFTVEEETALRGAREFIKDNKERINYYIALDGGYEGFTYGGIGIKWFRHHFIGPGGHTRSRTPPYSATLPLARAVARIYELPLPSDPPTHLNIGMLGGSEVVNAKAADAWFTVDLRSTSNEVIADLERKIAAIIAEEAQRAAMQARTELLSNTPAAQIPGMRQSPLVLTAEAVHLALGFENPPITPTASNNSNAALLAGLPAISTGAAPCGDAHALTEWCEIEPIYKGIKKVIALAVALAQLDER